MNFHHNLLKACLDNFHFEINNIKKNMNRMNDQRIVLLEQDLNNKKQEFSIEKEFLEKKIIESESKLQKYLKKEKEAAIISKTSSCSQTNEANEDNEFKKEYEKKYLTVFPIIYRNYDYYIILLVNSRKKCNCRKNESSFIRKK